MTPNISVQSTTQNFPASQCGYILFVPPEGGATQLLPVTQAAGMVLATKGRMYLIGFSWPGGTPGNSQRIGDHVFAIGVTFPPDFGSYQNHASQASGSANATGSTAFVVYKNGSSVGTITFAGGGVTPTFSTSGSAVRFAAGDKLTIKGPSTADATFADPCFTLVGYES